MPALARIDNSYPPIRPVGERDRLIKEGCAFLGLEYSSALLTDKLLQLLSAIMRKEGATVYILKMPTNDGAHELVVQ